MSELGRQRIGHWRLLGGLLAGLADVGLRFAGHMPASTGRAVVAAYRSEAVLTQDQLAVVVDEASRCLLALEAELRLARIGAELVADDRGCTLGRSMATVSGSLGCGVSYLIAELRWSKVCIEGFISVKGYTFGGFRFSRRKDKAFYLIRKIFYKVRGRKVFIRLQEIFLGDKNNLNTYRI